MQKLLDYWPKYLRELYEFYVLAGIWQPPTDQMWDDLRSMTEDFYLTSLTERGCARWEEMLGIIPAPEDTVEDRRNTILLMFQSSRPITLITLQRYLDTFNLDFYASVDYPTYTTIITSGSASDKMFDALLIRLRQMIPANMDLAIAMAFNNDPGLCFPAVLTITDYYEVT